MTDLSTIKAGEQKVKILHPGNKSELGITVTLMAPSDPRLDSLRKQISQKKLAEQARGKTPKVDELRAERLKILNAAITGIEWSGETNWKGETPDKPTIKVLTEMDQEAAWLIAQIDNAFGDEEAFFISAETN